MKKHLYLCLFVLLSFNLLGQHNWHLVPAQTIDVYQLLGKNDTLKVHVQALTISDFITYKEYKLYLEAVKKDSSALVYQKHLPDTAMVPKVVYEKYLNSTVYDSYPVMGISWENAMNYCKWLTLKEKQGDTLRTLYRLPTLSEWLSAYTYYSQQNIPHDLNVKYSDWLLDTMDESLDEWTRSIMKCLWIYFAAKIDPPSMHRKLVMGHSYLYRFKRLNDYRHVSYYDNHGYRQVGFRIVKDGMKKIPTCKYHVVDQIIKVLGIRK